MELLRSLKREQILEVLSGGFCHHCEDHLQARITSLRKRKVYETYPDDGIIASSRDASRMPVNGNAEEFYSRRLEKQWDSPRNSFLRHDSTLLMKRRRHAIDSSPRYLNSRKQSLMQSDFEFLLNDEIDGDNASEFYTRRLDKRGDSRQNSFQRHESTLLVKRSRHAADFSPRYFNSSKQQSDFELFSNDGTDEDNGSEFYTGRLVKQGDSPQNCFQRHESTADSSPRYLNLMPSDSELLNDRIGGDNGSEINNRKLENQGDSPQNSLESHEFILLMKPSRHDADSSPRYLNSSKKSLMQSHFELLLNDGIGGDSPFESGLSEEQKERIRCTLVSRKKHFNHIERINGRDINVLQGLELHTRVFNVEEQKSIVDYIYKLQRMGRNGQLRERTYSEPRKWMRGKGRVTIQFGCCYNYAVDKYGNPPGIIRNKEVDPLPPLFKQIIKRMVKWHILPSTCIPDSCIVNIYDAGDCIPPHIDHHDFVRPFSTVSLLSECKILFGPSLKVISPGRFSGPVSISLPVGSVFILNGNGADVAKHCVPSVSAKRISITFRKMDNSKLPYMFAPDPEMVGIKQLTYSPLNKTLTQYDKAKNSEIQQQKPDSTESDTDKKRNVED